MPPGAPWWAYLIPVGVDLVKGLIAGGASKAKNACKGAACEAKRRHKRTQEERMQETNVPDPINDTEGD